MNEIKSILQNYQNRDREYLLPILQDIQQENGFLSNDAIILVADYLKIPTSKVYAVATFYDRFRFLPKAKYRIQVCNGTGCHIEGSSMLLEEFEKHIGTRSGALTKSDLFSIEEVACLGACGNAPVVKINDVFYTNVKIEIISDLIAVIKAEEGI
jgi:NADH:ubiquinone oxidoreductase subunit E